MAGSQRQNGAELAGGEVVEGTKTAREFGPGQAALAIKPTQEVSGWRLPFAGIALG